MKIMRTALVTFIVAMAVTSVAAQSGGLRIVVLDAADQSPLPGAIVTLSNKVQLVAESGAHLLEPDAREALVGLLPRATVATPNLQEARALVETAGRSAPDDVEQLARSVHGLGPAVVVVTGGHGDGTDVFFDGERVRRIGGELYPGGAAHGSGCTHSSALAAHLALGHDPLEAARAAKKIAADVAKELTLAAGSRYKVKHDGNKVIVKKGNKKERPLAIEMTNQKMTGVSIMIGKK